MDEQNFDESFRNVLPNFEDFDVGDLNFSRRNKVKWLYGKNILQALKIVTLQQELESAKSYYPKCPKCDTEIHTGFPGVWQCMSPLCEWSIDVSSKELEAKEAEIEDAIKVIDVAREANDLFFTASIRETVNTAQLELSVALEEYDEPRTQERR